MHKKLFKFGNGMAMVIDAILRRPLNIDLDTRLHVTRQDREIVIERSNCDVVAVDKARVATASGYDIYRLTMLLRQLDGAGMSRHDFAKLSHDDVSLFAFNGTIGSGGLVSAVTIARLESFAEKLQAKMACAEAIAAVLVEIPEDVHWPPLRAA